MREASKKHLALLFGRNDLERIGTFLDRSGGFSRPGEMAIVRAIQDLQEFLSLDDILQGCEVEWKVNWAAQDPGIRGSPAAAGITGAQNTVSIENFYRVVRMSSPLAAAPLDIPTGFFAVLTRNSTYHLGAADFVGMRIVTRSPKSLFFGCGRVRSLAIGKPIVIEHVDNTRGSWQSTPVVSMRLE